MTFLQLFWSWIVANIFEVSILLTLWGHFYTLKRNQYTVAYKKKEEASNLIEGNLENVRIRLEAFNKELASLSYKHDDNFTLEKKKSRIRQDKVRLGIHEILREWDHVCRRIQSELVNEELLESYMAPSFLNFIKENQVFVEGEDKYQFIWLIYQKWKEN